MDCIVREVAKSWTRLSDFRFHFCLMPLVLSEGIRLPEPALQEPAQWKNPGRTWQQVCQAC